MHEIGNASSARWDICADRKQRFISLNLLTTTSSYFWQPSCSPSNPLTCNVPWSRLRIPRTLGLFPSITFSLEWERSATQYLDELSSGSFKCNCIRKLLVSYHISREKSKILSIMQIIPNLALLPTPLQDLSQMLPKDLQLKASSSTCYKLE